MLDRDELVRRTPMNTDAQNPVTYSHSLTCMGLPGKQTPDGENDVMG